LIACGLTHYHPSWRKSEPKQCVGFRNPQTRFTSITRTPSSHLTGCSSRQTSCRLSGAGIPKVAFRKSDNPTVGKCIWPAWADLTGCGRLSWVGPGRIRLIGFGRTGLDWAEPAAGRGQVGQVWSGVTDYSDTVIHIMSAGFGLGLKLLLGLWFGL